MAKKRKVNEASEGLKDCLECPVCMDCPMLPPIRQCANGHVICDSCATKVSICPTCRTAPVNIRNLFAEQVAKNIEVSCKFGPHCTFKPKYADYTTHVESCAFKPIACPWGCQEELVMSSQAIVDHLLNMHGAKKVEALFRIRQQRLEASAAFTVENPLGHTDAEWPKYIISAFDHNFLTHFTARKTPGNGCYKAWLQYIGPKQLTGSGAYEVSVNAQSRTLLFGGVLRCVREKPSEIENSNDCLVIDRAFAHYMSGKQNDDKGLHLRVTFTIHRD